MIIVTIIKNQSNDPDLKATLSALLEEDPFIKEITNERQSDPIKNFKRSSFDL